MSLNTGIVIAAIVIACIGVCLTGFLTYCFARRMFNKHLETNGMKFRKGHQRFQDESDMHAMVGLDSTTDGGVNVAVGNPVETQIIESRTRLHSEDHQNATLRAPTPQKDYNGMNVPTMGVTHTQNGSQVQFPVNDDADISAVEETLFA